jgi:bacterial/archaeal transporter family-2 protein
MSGGGALWLAPALMVVAGAMAATQTPTNAMLAGAVRSPVNAALVSFAVGTAVLLVAAALVRVRPDGAAVRALPWYAWLGGAYGAFFVAAAAYSAPRLGVAVTVTLLVAGQMVAAALLDQAGAFGLPQRDLTPVRLLGLALVVAGVVLVRRG